MLASLLKGVATLALLTVVSLLLLCGIGFLWNLFGAVAGTAEELFMLGLFTATLVVGLSSALKETPELRDWLVKKWKEASHE